MRGWLFAACEAEGDFEPESQVFAEIWLEGVVGGEDAQFAKYGVAQLLVDGVFGGEEGSRQGCCQLFADLGFVGMELGEVAEIFQNWSAFLEPGELAEAPGEGDGEVSADRRLGGWL